MMSLIHPSSSTAAPDTLARRIMQDAHLRDGLPEIVVGGILLLAAAQSYTMATLLHGGPLVLKRILILVWTFLVIALTFSTCSIPGAPGTGWLLRWLRRRYLISRYGYVKPRLEWNKRQLALYGGMAFWLLQPCSLPGGRLRRHCSIADCLSRLACLWAGLKPWLAALSGSGRWAC